MVLSVDDFGAVGDGVTNDRTAFQNAINAANAAGGNTVFIGNRIYSISGGELDIKEGVSLCGEFHPWRFFAASNYTGRPFQIRLDPTSWLRVRRQAAVDGILFTRNGLQAANSFRTGLREVANQAGTCVAVTNQARLTISAVTSNGAGACRITTASAHNLPANASYVDVIQTWKCGIPAMWGSWKPVIVNSTQIDLEGSVFSGTYDAANPAVLFLQQSGVGNVSDVRVSNCTMIGFDQGIYLGKASRGVVTNIVGDCRNGLFWSGCYDVGRVDNVIWNALQTGVSGNPINAAISGIVAGTANRARITTVPSGNNDATNLATGDTVTITTVRNSGASQLYGRWTITKISQYVMELDGSNYTGGWIAGGRVASTANARSGVGFAFSDMDGGYITGCFEYGHDTGWSLTNRINSMAFTGCGFDGYNDGCDPTTVGLKVVGNIKDTDWIGGFSAAKGTFLHLKNPSPGEFFTVTSDLVAGFNKALEVLGGSVIITGCRATNFHGGANEPGQVIYIGSAAGSVTATNTIGSSLYNIRGDVQDDLLKFTNINDPLNAGTLNAGGRKFSLETRLLGGPLQARLSSGEDGSLFVRNNTQILVDRNGHFFLRSYSKTALPAVSPAGQIIEIGDDVDGRWLARSDGTYWRWPDGTIVN